MRVVENGEVYDVTTKVVETKVKESLNDKIMAFWKEHGYKPDKQVGSYPTKFRSDASRCYGYAWAVWLPPGNTEWTEKSLAAILKCCKEFRMWVGCGSYAPKNLTGLTSDGTWLVMVPSPEGSTY